MSTHTVEHATRASRIGVGLIAIALVVLASAPLWGDRQMLRLLAELFTFIALASLWNLLAGYAGLVSVGQQAFVGLGGYLLFAMVILLDIHPIAAIFIAGPIAALVSIPVAALTFRLRGAYFAIGTWVGSVSVARLAGLGARRRLRHQPAVGGGDRHVADAAGAGVHAVLAGARPDRDRTRRHLRAAALASRSGTDRDPRQ
jgi:hypothetical protein